MPVGESFTVTPLARVSPAGKLIVEVVGFVGGAVVDRVTKPPFVWPTIVRLPVTATAVAGTDLTPATLNSLFAFAGIGPTRPIRPGPARLSRTRTGARTL